MADRSGERSGSYPNVPKAWALIAHFSCEGVAMRLEGFSVFGEGAALATVSGFVRVEFGYPNTKYFEGSSGAPGVFTPTPPTGARGVNKLRRGTAETPTPRTAISPEYEKRASGRLLGARTGGKTPQ